jgi:hypothetical protein
MTLGDEGCRLKKFQLRIGNIRQYMTDALALDPERVQAIKTAYKPQSKN